MMIKENFDRGESRTKKVHQTQQIVRTYVRLHYLVETQKPLRKKRLFTSHSVFSATFLLFSLGLGDLLRAIMSAGHLAPGNFLTSSFTFWCVTVL